MNEFSVIIILWQHFDVHAQVYALYVNERDLNIFYIMIYIYLFVYRENVIDLKDRRFCKFVS
jgi:hypothetical protein